MALIKVSEAAKDTDAPRLRERLQAARVRLARSRKAQDLSRRKAEIDHEVSELKLSVRRAPVAVTAD